MTDGKHLHAALLFIFLFIFFKVVVLLVGTNNHGHTPDMIADGIMAVVHLIRDKQPQAHIIVMVKSSIDP
jgi:hypothetical protein